MNFTDLYQHIITTAADLALATSLNDIPNVRILNFVCDKTRGGVLYISTFNDNQKVIEFNQNDKVAFTTVSVGDEQHVRVRYATVKKTGNATDTTPHIEALKSQFIQKYPQFECMFDQFGSELDIWEIHYNEANVVAEMGNDGMITF